MGSNPRFNPELKKQNGPAGPAPPKTPQGHRPDATPERTASWPGLPGNAQGPTRDKAGTPRIRQAAKSEGI